MSLIEIEARPAGPGLASSPSTVRGGTPGHDKRIDMALRRLACLAPLDDDERDLVNDLTGPLTEHRVGADLGDDGDLTCRLLLTGWACRVSETPWGRQILDFVLPGDPIGLSLRPRVDGLYRVTAITRGVTVDARLLRDRLRGEGGDFPGLMRACAEAERAAAARMVCHTNRLGGASATQAMAHLLLELRCRQAEVGLLATDRFPMPLSQECLHEALGITVTQVYRVLTQMRRDGLIALGPGWCEIANPATLAAAAGLKQWRG